MTQILAVGWTTGSGASEPNGRGGSVPAADSAGVGAVVRMTCSPRPRRCCCGGWPPSPAGGRWKPPGRSPGSPRWSRVRFPGLLADLVDLASVVQCLRRPRARAGPTGSWRRSGRMRPAGWLRRVRPPRWPGGTWSGRPGWPRVWRQAPPRRTRTRSPGWTPKSPTCAPPWVTRRPRRPGRATPGCGWWPCAPGSSGCTAGTRWPGDDRTRRAIEADPDAPAWLRARGALQAHALHLLLRCRLRSGYHQCPRSALELAAEPTARRHRPCSAQDGSAGRTSCSPR